MSWQKAFCDNPYYDCEAKAAAFYHNKDGSWVLECSMCGESQTAYNWRICSCHACELWSYSEHYHTTKKRCDQSCSRNRVGRPLCLKCEATRPHQP